jgi:hypothetical protein
MIGEGNLDHRIEIKGEDEFAGRQRSINGCKVAQVTGSLEMR